MSDITISAIFDSAFNRIQFCFIVEAKFPYKTITKVYQECLIKPQNTLH